MNVTSISAASSPRWSLRALWREVRSREPRLAWFGLVMLLAMLPALVAFGLDTRHLGSAGIWLKPLKFFASVGVFALTTAWFVGLLPVDARRGRAVAIVAWTIIACGTFEMAYIVQQAALGQASHYNFRTPLHVALYGLMGAAAMTMTATQVLLAWRIAKAPPAGDPVWRRGVLIGLVMTFVMGAGAGGLLGGLQPPAGAGLPVLGWHWGGDLRPAHFVGMHAQQLVPLAALALRSPRALNAFAIGYALLWAVLLAGGLNGAAPTALPPYDGMAR